MSNARTLGLPFALTAAVVALDQATKAAVVSLIPLNGLGFSALGDFFWVIHVRNPAVAFSLGHNLPPQLRMALFTTLPLLLIALILLYYFRAKGVSALQRWALCGIMGGGMGNLIDRAFRPEGVVDFLSVKFYGIFGFERWPTFNVADSSVVVCGILLVIAILLEERKQAS